MEDKSLVLTTGGGYGGDGGYGGGRGGKCSINQLTYSLMLSLCLKSKHHIGL